MKRNKPSELVYKGSLLVLLLLAAACNRSGSDALTPETTQQVSEQSAPTGVPEIRKIHKKGGTKIAVLVNNTPITNTDIRRRVAFVRLRKMRGNATKIARNELIDEALKLQEARRINAVASQRDVDAAYARFAKSNRMPLNALSQVLERSGVTKKAFKEHIRVSMSWQRAVAARLRAQSKSAEQSTGPRWLPDANTKSVRENEYTLQQVVFIVPRNKRQLLSRRRIEAKRFRTKLNGCSNARQLATGLKDVTVLDRGRFLESALPPQWRKEISSLKPGQVTRARDTEKGVEMIVLCKKRDVIGSADASNSDFFSADTQKKASALEKKYLAEIKERAVIKYH